MISEAVISNFSVKGIFLKFLGNSRENIQQLTTILNMPTKSIKKCFPRDCRCRSESRTAKTSNVEHFVTIIHGCQPLITTAKRSSILDVAAALDLPPCFTRHRVLGDILHQVLQIPNGLDQSMPPNTHHLYHPLPKTTTHHPPPPITHHPPPAKIYPPPSTTSHRQPKYIHHH